MQGTEALPVQTRWWDKFLHAWQAEHGVLPRQLVIYISGDLQCSPSRRGPALLPYLWSASSDMHPAGLARWDLKLASWLLWCMEFGSPFWQGYSRALPQVLAALLAQAVADCQQQSSRSPCAYCAAGRGHDMPAELWSG